MLPPVISFRSSNKLAISSGLQTSIPFAGPIYLVAAVKQSETEFWAAATSRSRATAAVQELLPTGWMAVPTRWRLSREKAAQLKLRAKSVCRINDPRGYGHACSG